MKWRARGVLSSYVRSRRRRGLAEDLEELPEPEATAGRPPDAAAQEELVDALEACRERLEPNLRETWRLRYDEELSLSEIQRRTGEPAGTLSVRLFRARKAIWSCLRRKGVV